MLFLIMTFMQVIYQFQKIFKKHRKATKQRVHLNGAIEMKFKNITVN